MSSMMTTAIPVQTAILQELRTKEFRPIDLLQALGNKGYTDSDIKQALSELLREGLIELTAQRLLKPAKTPDAA